MSVNSTVARTRSSGGGVRRASGEELLNLVEHPVDVVLPVHARSTLPFDVTGALNPFGDVPAMLWANPSMALVEMTVVPTLMVGRMSLISIVMAAPRQNVSYVPGDIEVRSRRGSPHG